MMVLPRWGIGASALLPPIAGPIEGFSDGRDEHGDRRRTGTPSGCQAVPHTGW